MTTRRSFLAALASGSSVLYAACESSTAVEPQTPDQSPFRLRFNARSPTHSGPTGSDVLLGDANRRAYLRVPPTYRPNAPAPLLIAFHGAGGRGTDWMGTYAARADAAGMILLAPDSVGQTWDAVTADFGPDVALVNNVVDQLFDRYAIDAQRIGLIGFSDGASYAISLGIANGDNVHQVIGFSPGFYVIAAQHGQPGFFISHGTSDPVLAIDQSSRVIVPALRKLGDSVDYVEFDGGHEVPAAIGDQAIAWLVTRFAH
ncbi:MAG: phospholipase [bacterium]